MSVEELFEKVQTFFGMPRDEQDQNNAKRDELLSLLDEKIESIKENIKDSDDIEQKESLKKEIDILVQLKKECEVDSKEEDTE